MHFSIDRTVHTTAFDKPVVDHWLERKIAYRMNDRAFVAIPTELLMQVTHYKDGSSLYSVIMGISKRE